MCLCVCVLKQKNNKQHKTNTPNQTRNNKNITTHKTHTKTTLEIQNMLFVQCFSALCLYASVSGLSVCVDLLFVCVFCVFGMLLLFWCCF